MFGAFRNRLADPAAAPATAAASPPPAVPASPFFVPPPAPLVQDAALQARTAAFAAACWSHVPVHDRALAGLVEAGKLRPDQQDYARDHRLRFAEALHAIETLELEVAQYSACWASPEDVARLPPDALRNLVVVGRKPRDSAAGA